MEWLRRIFRFGGPRHDNAAEQELSAEQRQLLQDCVPYYHLLSLEHRERLAAMVHAFIREKQFIAHPGVEIDDEVRITIAGMACLLLVGLPRLGVYPGLHEVIVRPQRFGEELEAIGPDGRKYTVRDMRIGEAWHRGPIVLAWDNVRHAVAAPCDGYNVVFHEFAHAIDGMDGKTNGSPPMESDEQAAEWSRVFSAAYDAFMEANRQGETTFLDPYGASSPAEFFAVVTEHFFEQPRQMLRRHRLLYEQLKRFYRQDPAHWPRQRTGHWR